MDGKKVAWHIHQCCTIYHNGREVTDPDELLTIAEESNKDFSDLKNKTGIYDENIVRE